MPPSGTGVMDRALAMRILAATGDIAVLVDEHGVIEDLATGGEPRALADIDAWRRKRLSDTVSADSRPKVEELLREAARGATTRWREINHPLPGGATVAMRYMALGADGDGRVIAIGRDHSRAADLQQRLLRTQQALERDYGKVREAEFRYRLLFQISGEAILVVDAQTRRIVESNPAADRLLDADGSLVGKAFARAFAVQSQDDAVALLALATRAGGGPAPASATLVCRGRDLVATATPFRIERQVLALVRLATAERRDTQGPARPNRALLAAIEQLPDGLVVCTPDYTVIAHNAAFLQMVQLADSADLIGQPLQRFLGRPGVDRMVLEETLDQHGVARGFSTVVRSRLGETEDVEVSAVVVPDPDLACVGFSIRRTARRVVEGARAGGAEPPHSADDLAELVGKVALKDIVRDTTDYVERLCIEAALRLTGDNRASAADVLGLSRQSLYSKMRRFGIGNLDDEVA